MSAQENLPVDYRLLTSCQRRVVRNQYVKAQKGNCSYCKSPLSGDPAPSVKSKPVNARRFPYGFFSWPVHLHHCHKTGMTIGAVHSHCNAVLWQYHGE